MDVRCSRCATEYEFDDALISERGTTVKCTNCGFQFKIFPPKAAAAVPERWLVRTAAGRDLVYTSLRELQRGISDRQVGPNDLLSRGNAPARPLGSIPELEPFFAASASRPANRAPRTLHGVAPPGGAVAAGGPAADAPPSSTADTARVPLPEATRAPAPPPMTPVLAAPVARVEQGTLDATLPAAAQSPFTPRAPEPVVLPSAPPTAPSPKNNPDLPPRSQPVQSQSAIRSTPGLVLEPASNPHASPGPISARRESYASYDEFHPEGAPDATRRARSRWIAAIVILGLVGLFGATIGRQYLERFTSRPAPAPVPTQDNRVAGFLRDAEREVDEGDFEGAKEHLVKAQTLADKNPAVMTALARLETMRADLYWLKVRLLDPLSKELVTSTLSELGRRVGKARQAVDAAFAIAPEDPTVVRARIDSMRLSGDADKAREWLGPVAAKPSEPENAYVLAALDMAETNPPWPSIVERLRPAAASKKEGVRARAALIYALVQSGAIAEAETEFQKLQGEEPTHPLIDELKSFVQRVKAAPRDAGADAAAAASAVVVDVNKLPALDTSPAAEPAARAEAPGDFRQRLVQAAAAVHSGDLSRAQQLYQGVLNEQPNNTEALSGLADVAKRRGDPATAARLYQRVLDQNPSYLPALMASADAKWDSGDRKGAVVVYRRILEQAGAGSDYGQRAAARIAEAGKDTGGTTAPATQPAQPAPATPTPPPPPPKSDQPAIDTSDLPGFGK